MKSSGRRGNILREFYTMRPVPFESVIISILVEQQKALKTVNSEQ